MIFFYCAFALFILLAVAFLSFNQAKTLTSDLNYLEDMLLQLKKELKCFHCNSVCIHSKTTDERMNKINSLFDSKLEIYSGINKKYNFLRILAFPIAFKFPLKKYTSKF